MCDFMKRKFILLLVTIFSIASTQIGVMASEEKNQEVENKIAMEIAEEYGVPVEDVVVGEVITESEGTTISEYEMLKRSLSDEEIAKLYSESQKEEMMTLGIDSATSSVLQRTNTELFESSNNKSSLFSDAKVYLDHNITTFAYIKSLDKTVAFVSFEWEWNKKPNFCMNDIVAFGWEVGGVMYLDQNSSCHYLSIKYYNQNEEYNRTVRKGVVQTAGSAISFDIPMVIAEGTPGNDRRYYAKKGSGMFKLVCAGKERNITVSYKHGHQFIRFGLPSIGAPWGIDFGLEHVDSITEHEIQCASIY